MSTDVWKWHDINFSSTWYASSVKMCLMQATCWVAGNKPVREERKKCRSLLEAETADAGAQTRRNAGMQECRKVGSNASLRWDAGAETTQQIAGSAWLCRQMVDYAAKWSIMPPNGRLCRQMVDYAAKWLDYAAKWSIMPPNGRAWHVFKMENAKMNNGNGMFSHAHPLKKLTEREPLPRTTGLWKHNICTLNGMKCQGMQAM
jgi:hypothetical protein